MCRLSLLWQCLKTSAAFKRSIKVTKLLFQPVAYIHSYDQLEALSYFYTSHLEIHGLYSALNYQQHHQAVSWRLSLPYFVTFWIPNFDILRSNPFISPFLWHSLGQFSQMFWSHSGAVWCGHWSGHPLEQFGHRGIFCIGTSQSVSLERHRLEQTNTWTIEHLNTWTLGHLNTWALGHLNTWTLGHYAVCWCLMSALCQSWNRGKTQLSRQAWADRVGTNKQQSSSPIFTQVSAFESHIAGCWRIPTTTDRGDEHCVSPAAWQDLDWSRLERGGAVHRQTELLPASSSKLCLKHRCPCRTPLVTQRAYNMHICHTRVVIGIYGSWCYQMCRNLIIQRCTCQIRQELFM